MKNKLQRLSFLRRKQTFKAFTFLLRCLSAFDKRSTVISSLAGNLIIFFLIFSFSSCKNESQHNKEKSDSKQNLEKELISVSDENFENQNDSKKFEARQYRIKLYDLEKWKDTIVNFDYLESDETLDYTFDYKPLEKRFRTDSLILIRSNVEIVLIKSKFKKDKSKLHYDSDSLNIIEIDNHRVFGSDSIPSEFISDIYLNIHGNHFKLEKIYFQDLYEPDFERTHAYVHDNEVIIEMHNSDGYLGYSVRLFIDKLKNVRRIIYMP